MSLSVGKQEEVKHCSVESWLVPSLTYNLVVRCLNETVSLIRHNSSIAIFLFSAKCFQIDNICAIKESRDEII